MNYGIDGSQQVTGGTTGISNCLSYGSSGYQWTIAEQCDFTIRRASNGFIVKRAGVEHVFVDVKSMVEWIAEVTK